MRIDLPPRSYQAPPTRRERAWYILFVSVRDYSRFYGIPSLIPRPSPSAHTYTIDLWTHTKTILCGFKGQTYTYTHAERGPGNEAMGPYLHGVISLAGKVIMYMYTDWPSTWALRFASSQWLSTVCEASKTWDNFAHAQNSVYQALSLLMGGAWVQG